MRAILTAAPVCAASVCVAIGAQAVKPPAGLVEARVEYSGQVDTARAAYNDAVKQAAQTHRKRLAGVLDAETKAGNLDGALLVREEMRALDADGPPTLLDALGPTRARWVAGTWALRYHPNGATRTYTIHTNGEVSCKEGAMKGVLKPAGMSFTLEFGDGKLERVTFAGGRAFFEHFDPKANAERNAVGQVAIAELQKK